MALNLDFWKKKKVFITGHTGFKGGWMVLWMQRMGASIVGYSLPAPTEPNLYSTACVNDGIQSITADIRQKEKLQAAMEQTQPDIAFHFAAQPLVRAAYLDPVYTYDVNVMGTVNFLESVRKTPSIQAAIIVTSDKCYENPHSSTAFRETDALGGREPYGNSKACCELVTDAYRRSFLNNQGVGVATVRAGNVIGGGDWADDRLIPDAVRSFSQEKELRLRYPEAIRPWQFVLEPLNGYLLLAQKLMTHGLTYAKGWNFGPSSTQNWRVVDIVREAAKLWGQGARWSNDSETSLQESLLLKLDVSLARQQLKWKSLLDTHEALRWTMDWYRAYANGTLNMRDFSLHQIDRYMTAMDNQ